VVCSRVAALQNRWDRLCARLDLILDQRGADMADLPGGASGLLARDARGKNADRLVTRIDPGGLAGRRTARSARPPRNWSRKTHREEHKVIDASAAAIAVAFAA
jgi:hypothetical protein